MNIVRTIARHSSFRKPNTAVLTEVKFYKERNLPLWKKIFHIPSDSIWYSLITILSYIAIVHHLYYAVNGKCLTYLDVMAGIHYQMDVVYFVDVVLCIGSKYIKKLHLPDICISMRPICVLVLEILSVIPFEIFIPRNTKQQEKIFCLLRLNRCFRIVRILYFYYRYRNLVTTKIYMGLVEMTSSMIFVIMLSYFVYCHVICFGHNCSENNKCLTMDSVKMITSKVLQCAFTIFPTYNFHWELIATATKFIHYSFVLTFAFGYVTLAFVEKSYHQFIYVSKYNVVMQMFDRYHLPRYFKDVTMQFYNKFWEERGGYDTDISHLLHLPPTLCNEILIDVYWPAFKHSKLFREMELHFLRYIARFVKQQFMLPGDIVYRKNELKDKMVYVLSGTIQILSEIDGESPIMTLANGSCLGETSLFISYKSINSVRCKTFCEFHVLQKTDYLQGIKKYQHYYRLISKDIYNRYTHAKLINKFSKLARSKMLDSYREIDTYTMYWLKNSLHTLMATDAESKYRHEFQNIYLLNEIRESDYDKLTFSAKYLDLYAIGTRIEADMDTVFVKSHFPCILQSNSVLVKIWESYVILCTVIAAFVIPYMSFIAEEPKQWYLPVLYTITTTFWFDIYIQLSTGVKSKYGITTTFSEIVTIKLQNFNFWIDMLTCLPFEVFSPVILNSVTSQTRARMHINRLFKIWRIHQLFHEWENKFNVNIILIIYLKFFSFTIYLIFLFYCKLYYLTEEGNSKVIFIAVQIATCVGLMEEDVKGNDFIYVAYSIGTSFVYILLYSHIGSAYLLSSLHKLEVHEITHDIIEKVNKIGLGETYIRKIDNFIMSQWQDNQCWNLQTSKSLLGNLTASTYSEVIEYISGDMLRRIPFFKGFSDEALLDLCAVTILTLYAPGEPVYYAGQLSGNIYILYEGQCEVVNNKGTTTKMINTGCAPDILAACFDVPLISSLITNSYCRFFTIKYQTLVKVLGRYPNELKALTDTISASSDLKHKYLQTVLDYGSSINLSFTRATTGQSLVRFGYALKVDSYEEYDYFTPFDRLYPFGVIRFLLMRYTVKPDGKLIYIWESFRSAFAILSSILYFVYPLVQSEHALILYFLDITAVVDIYFRLHVCYYNEYGLLITHPLKTATHYLGHGFILDCIAVLPLQFVVQAGDFKTYFFLHINRLLQMHRYFSFFSTLENTSSTIDKFHAFANIPFMVVLVNLCGSLVMNSECTIDPYVESNNIFSKGIVCNNDSMLAISPFNKPIDAFRAHLYGVYVATSALTTIGMQGFVLKAQTPRIIIMVLSIVGLYMTVYMVGRMLALYSFRHGSLLENQVSIAVLRHFLNTVDVSQQLKRAILDIYELKWSRLIGKTMFNLTTYLHKPLQNDILFDTYGKNMYDKSIFSNRSHRFYRNLLPHLKHDIIPKGGYIETINDVNENMYILHSGMVDVLAADGTRLTTLYPGSIFGNLENFDRCRQLISVIATVHAEIMIIKSLLFYKVLNYSPDIREEFLMLKEHNLTYIPSKVIGVEINQKVYISPEMEYFKDTIYMHVFDPKSRGMQIWNTINLVFSCYFGILLELYQLGVSEFSGIMKSFQYFSDALYTVHYFLRYRTAYEDESGVEIRDLILIKKRLNKNKLYMWLGVISLLPIDVFILLLPIKGDLQNLLFHFTRFNRFIRLTYIFEYFKSARKKVNINIFATNFAYTLLCSTLSLHAVACILGVFNCIMSENMQPHESYTDVKKLASMEKFQLYIRYLYITVDCFTLTAQHVYYPQGKTHIILFVAIMLVGHSIYIVCFSQIFSVLKECNHIKFQFQKIVERMIYFMDHEDVSVSTITRVKTYMQVLWSEQMGIVFPKLLAEAPLYMQDAILNNAFSHLLVDHPIFQKCHPDCLRQIVQNMRPRKYLAGDYIQFKGAVDDSMHFIFKGEVVVLEDEYLHRDNELLVLKSGDSFGVLQGLFRNIPHNFSYRSNRKSILITLNINSWEYLLKYFPASKENIYQAADLYNGI